MIINAVCEKKEQAESLKGIKGLGRIYSPEDIMPYVFRNKDASICEKYLERDELIIRNYDELGFLKERGYKGRIKADHTLYSFNKASIRFLKEAGVHSDTAPLELDCRELKRRGVEDSELMIYGRIPMMISAGCVYKNAREGKCRKGLPGKASGINTEDQVIINETAITDRMGAVFPVLGFCSFCYNVIFNSVPLSLHNEKDRISKLSPASLRLYFTTEDGEQTRKTAYYFMELFGDVNGFRKGYGMPFKDYTKGHFIKKTE